MQKPRIRRWLVRFPAVGWASFVCFLAGLLPAAALPSVGVAADRPHIVMILADDLGLGDLTQELYHLRLDPSEQNNLAAVERQKFRELAAALRVQTQRGGAVPWQPPERVDAP